MRSDLEQLQEEAERFIYTCYEELGHSREDAEARLVAVMGEIEVTGYLCAYHRRIGAGL